MKIRKIRKQAAPWVAMLTALGLSSFILWEHSESRFKEPYLGAYSTDKALGDVKNLGNPRELVREIKLR